MPESRYTPVRAKGESFVWLTSMGLALGLLMIVFMLGLIAWQGIGAFWPERVHAITVDDEAAAGLDAKLNHRSTFNGAIVHRRAKLGRTLNEVTGEQEKGKEEWQFFLANKDLYGESFLWLEKAHIADQRRAAGIASFERVAYGDALGYPVALQSANGLPMAASSPGFEAELAAAVEAGEQLRHQAEALEKGPIGAISDEQAELAIALRAMARAERDGQVVEKASRQALQARQKELEAEYQALMPKLVAVRQALNERRLVYALTPVAVNAVRFADIVSAELALPELPAGQEASAGDDGHVPAVRLVLAGGEKREISGYALGMLLPEQRSESAWRTGFIDRFNAALAARDERRQRLAELEGQALPAARSRLASDLPEAELAAARQTLAALEAELAALRDVETADAWLLYGDQPAHVQVMSVGAIIRYFYPNRLGFMQRVGHTIAAMWHFVSEEPREANTEGGVFPAIFGTFLMTLIMSVLVTPFGVIAAIYLREYAKQGPLVRMVRISINNLAGVPSIVFGVFGLGFFVYFVGGQVDSLFYPERLPTATFGTGGILWASLTLALLTVPVVIVATEEALAAVPRGAREGALACGASKWQAIQRVVLPAAAPGVMTGIILAMARGAGEVAPLMLVGVIKHAPKLPMHLQDKFMHLGFHIYDLGFQSPDAEAAKPMVFATTLLLITLVVVLNLAAIVIRERLRRKYATAAF